MSKSEKIHQLVRQVNEGDLDQDAFFDELAKLHSASSEGYENRRIAQPVFNFKGSIGSVDDEQKRYGQKDVRYFIERVTLWAEAKKISRDKLLQAKESEELRSCTFSPRINKYKPFIRTVCANRNDLDISVGNRASLRLFEHSKKKKQTLLQNQKREKLKELERLKRVCTFTPALNKTSSNYRPRRFSYNRPKCKQIYTPREEAEYFDFMPKVNQTRVQSAQAKKYLETNIFERLATAKQPRPQSARNNVYAKRPYSEVSSCRDTPSQRGRSGQFNAFLQRQEIASRKQSERLKSRGSQYSHSPSINRNSKELAYRTYPRDHQSRVKLYIEKKNMKSFRSHQKSGEEPRFQPEITSTGKKTHSRVLSTNQHEVLAREKKIKFLRRQLELDCDEMRNLTFKPKLSSETRHGRYRHVEGKLKITADPNGYITRLKKEKDEAVRKKLLYDRLNDLHNMNECTFKPNLVARYWRYQ
eukprot:snap_masked-scaffold_13-processed-gene-10.26-mRNA-1 protein AED:1.00 eAED:1.00 QI:0/0/0/0/1/1/2/0/471